MRQDCLVCKLCMDKDVLERSTSTNDECVCARVSYFRNPLAQMEEERREHEAKMKKMEQEMEQVFEMKVKEKTQKLKDSEADVSDRNRF